MGTLTPDELEALRRESQQPVHYPRGRLAPGELLVVMTGCFILFVAGLMVLHWWNLL